MDWHVQHRRGRTYQVDWFGSPEAAIEAACRLMDSGSEVLAIGTELLSDTIGKDEIVRIYAMWTAVLKR